MSGRRHLRFSPEENQSESQEKTVSYGHDQDKSVPDTEKVSSLSDAEADDVAGGTTGFRTRP